MNRKLTDVQIAATAETLRQEGRRVGWRVLQAALTKQYGAAGRTDRLRAICRASHEPVDEHSLTTELRRQAEEGEQRCLEAQQQRDQALSRAQRSEQRETAHQDRWAAEIHALREAVEQLRGERARRQSLEDQVVRLQRELQGLYGRLARFEGQ